VFFGQELVDIFHAGVHSGEGGALQLGIQRGVDANVLAAEFVFGVFLQEVVLHHVNEVGRFAAGDGGADYFEWGTLGVLHVGFGDVLVLEHLSQHAIARLCAALGMTVSGGVVVGSANDAGKIGAFAEGELAKIFAEIGDAGLGKSAKSEAAAIS